MRKIVVANWKMNGSARFVTDYLDQVMAHSSEAQHDLVICPPSPYLSLIAARVEGSPIAIGGQDCASAASGAFTGDVAASMLADLGCRYVIVGHSERRGYHHESSDQVRQKAEQAMAAGLTPIICIGESLEARLSGATIPTLLEQLSHSLPILCASEPPHNAPRYLVAYEPIWAIGTGKTATLEDITAVHQALRDALCRLAEASCATHDLGATPLLYGGSVTADNAASIMALPLVDGVLVGGASLKPDALLTILISEK